MTEKLFEYLPEGLFTGYLAIDTGRLGRGKRNHNKHDDNSTMIQMMPLSLSCFFLLLCLPTTTSPLPPPPGVLPRWHGLRFCVGQRCVHTFPTSQHTFTAHLQYVHSMLVFTLFQPFSPVHLISCSKLEAFFSADKKSCRSFPCTTIPCLRMSWSSITSILL